MRARKLLDVTAGCLFLAVSGVWAQEDTAASDPAKASYEEIKTGFDAGEMPAPFLAFSVYLGVLQCSGQNAAERAVLLPPEAGNAPMDQIKTGRLTFIRMSKTGSIEIAGGGVAWFEGDHRYEVRQSGSHLIVEQKVVEEKRNEKNAPCYAFFSAASAAAKAAAVAPGGPQPRTSPIAAPSPTLQALQGSSLANIETGDGEKAAAPLPLVSLGGAVYVGKDFDSSVPTFNHAFTGGSDGKKYYQGLETGADLRLAVRPQDVSLVKGIDLLGKVQYGASEAFPERGHIDATGEIRYWPMEWLGLGFFHAHSWNTNEPGDGDTLFYRTNCCGNTGQIQETGVEAIVDPWGLEFKKAPSGVLWGTRINKIPGTEKHIGPNNWPERERGQGPERGSEIWMKGQYTFENVRVPLPLTPVVIRDVALSSTFKLLFGTVWDAADAYELEAKVSAYLNDGKNLKIEAGHWTTQNLDSPPLKDPHGRRGSSSEHLNFIRLVYEDWNIFAPGPVADGVRRLKDKFSK